MRDPNSKAGTSPRTPNRQAQELDSSGVFWNRSLALTVGDVAQLGERLVRNEEVRGSTPLISTIPHMASAMFVMASQVRNDPEEPGDEGPFKLSWHGGLVHVHTGVCRRFLLRRDHKRFESQTRRTQQWTGSAVD